MISNEVKEKLLQKNWYVECKTEQEVNLLLQACDDAGITWNAGQKATEFKPYKHYSVDIGFCEEDNGITQDIKYYKESEIENITDWFFNAIKNNDDNCFWKQSDSNCIFLNTEYRIAPKPTPLITREMWAMIAPEWKWVAMDSDGEVYFYTDEPYISARGFDWANCGGDYCNSVLAINTDSINWERSLTERPEDV